jgi:hypothetical protein
MIAEIAADLILIIHLAFIAFVIAGGILALKWKRIVFIHIPCVLWGALIEFKGWICPLTPIENQLRKVAGDNGYSGGFIEHYIMPLVYPQSLTQKIQILLGIGVLVANFCVYRTVFMLQKKKEISNKCI